MGRLRRTSFSQKPSDSALRFVKAVFHVDPPVEGCSGERMWVRVTRIRDDGTVEGKLRNHPVVRTDLEWGDTVHVKASDIVEVIYDEDE